MGAHSTLLDGCCGTAASATWVPLWKSASKHDPSNWWAIGPASAALLEGINLPPQFEGLCLHALSLCELGGGVVGMRRAVRSMVPQSVCERCAVWGRRVAVRRLQRCGAGRGRRDAACRVRWQFGDYDAADALRGSLVRYLRFLRVTGTFRRLCVRYCSQLYVMCVSVSAHLHAYTCACACEYTHVCVDITPQRATRTLGPHSHCIWHPASSHTQNVPARARHCVRPSTEARRAPARTIGRCAIQCAPPVPHPE